MKALKIVGLAVGIIVLGVFALVMTAPAAKHVETTIIINASAGAVYREANSFKSFDGWSFLSDPDAQYAYEGPSSGVGARVRWSGPKAGKGYQEIVESEENLHIRSILNFEGFPGTYISELRLEPVDGGTKVTLTYDSDYSKAAGMSGSMGRVIELFQGASLEDRYDAALKGLKRVVERNPEQD